MKGSGSTSIRWLLVAVCVLVATVVVGGNRNPIMRSKLQPQYPTVHLPFNSPHHRFSNNDVYPTYGPPPTVQPQETTTTFSASVIRNMSQTTDLREYIMKYVEDERICTSTSLRDLILGTDGGDLKGELWWNRRCTGRRGNINNPLNTASAPALSESTLIRYRRKSSYRASRKRTLDLNTKVQAKITKLMRDKRILCKPKKTTVPLPNDQPGRLSLQPSCVYIKQCGGCCEHNLLECMPTKTKNRKFPVMAFEQQGRRRRFANNAFRYVRVEEHKQCQCMCKVQPEHCSPRQIYNSDACRCSCPSHTFSQCPRGKVWDDKQCECVCTGEAECTTGRVFDRNTCRCADPQLKDPTLG